MKHGEMRTRVKNGACVFKSGNRCAIHGESFYPIVCKRFPWQDAFGGPYSEHRDEYVICPDVAAAIANDA